MYSGNETVADIAGGGGGGIRGGAGPGKGLEDYNKFFKTLFL